jgi:hypothetical protein
LTQGFAATIDVNLNGITTVNDFSDQTSVTSTTHVVPEPSSFAFISTAALLMCGLRRFQKRRSS